MNQLINVNRKRDFMQYLKNCLYFNQQKRSKINFVQDSQKRDKAVDQNFKKQISKTLIQSVILQKKIDKKYKKVNKQFSYQLFQKQTIQFIHKLHIFQAYLVFKTAKQIQSLPKYSGSSYFIIAQRVIKILYYTSQLIKSAQILLFRLQDNLKQQI
ncbi:hypothetical protein ABPG72_016198 [Tetrahymena utriculariae]